MFTRSEVIVLIHR